MRVIKNLDNKRVCDISADNRTVTIKIRNCATIIKANPNGTLKVAHKYIFDTRKQ